MRNVGIIGAGLVGGKRAAALAACGARLVAVADKSLARAESLARAHGARAHSDWRAVLSHPEIEAVIVATSNDVIVECAMQALRAGKHVLVEKPAGRNPVELKALTEAAENARTVLRVGFNHRFHPAFQEAKRLLTAGALGPLMYFRGRYGHGGRIGYDREWRANPAISGGGELLDQGVHLIDLCRWLGGELELEYGRVDTLFWDMPVEDNGFLFLKAPGKKLYAHLHASCTEWKNLFDFEIFGRTGKLQVSGLGRSYGEEELRFFKMKPEMGPPGVEILKFPGEDLSWQLELAAFFREIQGEKTDLGTARDGLRAVEIVHDAYRQSEALVYQIALVK